MNLSYFSLININTSKIFINPVNTLVTGEVTVERNGYDSSRF